MVRKKGLKAILLGPMSPIVLRVREARKAKGWTQAQLAKRAGVRRATISSLESPGRQRVNMGVLEKVAKALRVPVLQLLQETRGGKP